MIRVRLTQPGFPLAASQMSGSLSCFDRVTPASMSVVPKWTDAYLRWVTYVPFATPESTGLSTKPSDNAPWLMYSGTAGAHIMINPPKK
jgi:hypothetical protein